MSVSCGKARRNDGSLGGVGSSGGWRRLARSRGSGPAMNLNNMAQSTALPASGPTQSSDGASGIAPAALTRPVVGFNPTTPQHAAGIRMEPPESEPIAPETMPAATAAAGPL